MAVKKKVTKKKTKKKLTGHQFKKGHKESVGFGRPKMTEAEKELSLKSRTQFKTIINKYMIQDKKELMKIYRGAKTPALDCMIIKSILKSLETGDQSSINWFANHILGKEKETTHLELSGGVESTTGIDLKNLSKEQLVALKEIAEQSEGKKK